MAAFERICSGIPTLDLTLDNIRLGDNVVFQVSSLDEFRPFAEAFAAQAIRDRRDLVYVRFAEHPPILEAQEGLKIVQISPGSRFETFTIEVHRLIETEGIDAFYVFDCLSGLEEAWATDLMMGNFFHLTCPYLFSLDTVAFFPIIRGRHSFDAITIIRETTQLFLDVLPGPGEGELYLRPIKVWNRESDSMFSPHLFDLESGIVRELSEGVEISRFYRKMNETDRLTQNQSMDSWERFFQITGLKFRSGSDVTDECGRICDIMLTRDGRMRELIRKYFLPEDYFEIHSRMVGTGMIGGKACGMLLSRKIIECLSPEIFSRIEPHDSFYIGSDVFYSYIVENGFWDLKIRQKTEEGYFALADSFAGAIMSGRFSAATEAEFLKLLEYYGSDPVIVRSSSILEDGFGNAFAGKYESVFCSCTGTPEERLAEFEQAVRSVYASTMSMSALDYRKRRGLENRDEQMALLVQRVSGSRYGDFVMPTAAGVGYSVSPYHMGMEKLQHGMLRLVAGLGTAAVDRRTGSYPRMVALDDPGRVLLTNTADRHQFSQRLIDIIRAGEEPVRSTDAELVRRMLPAGQVNLLYSHDRDAEREFRERGISEDVFYVSCDRLVQNAQLMDDMRKILALLQSAYAYPVDIEYTINVSDSGEYRISLLQCRPLQLAEDGGRVRIPQDVSRERVLLETKGVSMGFSRQYEVDAVVYVDPVAYYRMPYREKGKVRNILSAINWKFRSKNKRLILLTPGRICTSSPELGVPSAFSDISEFSVICEVSESRAGYMPELSYGSHIFQDLVEAGILYTAVFEGDSTLRYRPQLLTDGRNMLDQYAEADGELRGIVYVKAAPEEKFALYYDMSTEHLLITCGAPSARNAVER